MKNMEWSVLLSLALAAAAVIGYLCYSMFLKSVVVSVPRGDNVAEIGDTKSSDTIATTQIAELLVAAGLNSTSALGDIGVDGHMQRLAQGEVSDSSLVRYAQNLTFIGEVTATTGARIPAGFWDVETPALKSNGWNVYRIVHELAQDHSAPYLEVLARAYARFVRLKADDTATADSAVDTALDILLIARDYVKSIPPERLLQHAPEISTEVHAILMAWQNLVAGTTRLNPITHKPVFSHGFMGRYNVSTIHQCALGEAMSISDAWGVSGFADRFVGIASNANQVEHLSISIILQAVLRKPLLVLNAIEEEKVLLQGGDKAEANADMALNTAVHNVFLPLVNDNMVGAIEALRTELKKQ